MAAYFYTSMPESLINAAINNGCQAICMGGTEIVVAVILGVPLATTLIGSRLILPFEEYHTEKPIVFVA